MKHEETAGAVAPPFERGVRARSHQEKQDDFARNVVAALDAEERLLAEHRGEWLLVHDGQVADICLEYAQALGTGYERFGLDIGFIVHEIQDPSPTAIAWRQRQRDAATEYASWFPCRPNDRGNRTWPNRSNE